jgi:hypothetical protein
MSIKANSLNIVNTNGLTMGTTGKMLTINNNVVSNKQLYIKDFVGDSADILTSKSVISNMKFKGTYEYILPIIKSDDEFVTTTSVQQITNKKIMGDTNIVEATHVGTGTNAVKINASAINPDELYLLSMMNSEAIWKPACDIYNSEFVGKCKVSTKVSIPSQVETEVYKINFTEGKLKYISMKFFNYTITSANIIDIRQLFRIGSVGIEKCINSTMCEYGSCMSHIYFEIIDKFIYIKAKHTLDTPVICVMLCEIFTIL